MTTVKEQLFQTSDEVRQAFPHFSSAIATHPFLPANDATFTFLVRDEGDYLQEVPVYYNHDYEQPPIGRAVINYLPIHKSKEGKMICCAFAAVFTTNRLLIGMPVSIAFAEVFRKGKVRFGDGVFELSVVDKATTPLCEVIDASQIPQLITGISSNPDAVRNFANLLKDIGELE
jgi:hypothetical protein